MNSATPDLKAVFGQAAEIASPAERAAYLDEACGDNAKLRGQIDDLLAAAETAGSFMRGPAVAHSKTERIPPVTERPGAVIGPYKLLQQIGEGGMGVVWMAEQTQPVQRKVALKVIKPGMDSRQVIARFEAERQALAMMDHVNIARVLDAGATESGLPYFVMELVHGVPITKYCDDNHLTPRERLKLFVPVCQAIQHAHQKGIIHRDIKPSNVMITLYDGKPVPKVIDFGVAKATEQKLTERTLFTQYGTMVGTLEYMSPEQAEMSALGVDTRSDIFSLGVLLYELLTGSTPLTRKRLKEAAYAEVLRLIKEEEPPKPSTRLSDSGEALASISAQRQMEPAKLSKLIRGELDWIVMKTLEKDRNRRYETASGFAADVQRYLNDEPVQACPPTAGYRFRKFARRNKRALAASAMLSVALLVAVGAVAGSLGWVARDRAARQSRMVRELQVALERAELFQDDGKRAESLAAFERAELFAAEAALDPIMQKRLAVLKERLDAEAQDHAFVSGFEEIRQLQQSQVDEAGSRFAVIETLPKIRELLQKYGFEIAVTPPAHATARIRGRPEAIQGQLFAALDECLIFASAEDSQTLLWLNRVLYSADGNPWRTQVRKTWSERDWQALEQLARQVEVQKQPPSFLLAVASLLSGISEPTSLELYRRTQRAYPGDFWANHNLADALAKGGRPAQGISYYTAALALRPRNPGVYLNRANALKAAGELDAAIADLCQALVIAPRYATAHVGLGTALKAKGDMEGAIASYRQAIAIAPKLAVAHNDLGVAMREQGKLDEAVTCCRKAVELDPKSALALNNLGVTLDKQEKRDEAIACYRKAIELDPKYAPAHCSLGAALNDQGKLDEAIASHKKAIELDPKDAGAQSNLGVTLYGQGKVDEAIACYRKAIELDPKYAGAYYNLGNLLEHQMKPEEAIASYKKALELDPKFAPACYNLGIALYGQGKVDEAIACFRKVIELEPTLALAHSNLGSALGNQKKVDEAITCFRKAIELDPKDAKAHGNLGIALYGQGKVDEAIACFRKVIELEPKDADAHNNLAWLLATGKDPKLRDPKSTVELAQKAVELEPKNALFWQTLGVAQYRAANWRGAIAALEKVKELGSPGDSKEWFPLAMAHWQLGEKNEARELYDRAIAWMDKNGLNDEELRRFREEAATLLKVQDPSKPVPMSK